MNDKEMILQLRKGLLGQELDSLYHNYNDRKYIQYDPIKYVYRFEDPVERELVALVASSLAFGRVTQIFKAIDRMLEIVNNEPLRYVMNLGEKPDAELCSFKYRFVGGLDMHHLFVIAKRIIVEYGSIGDFMKTNYETGALLALAENTIKTFQGTYYLIPSSLRGSPCKRLFMYFRWMVRNDNIDLGLWNFIDPGELVIPLDTHIFRLSKKLGFTSRRTPSLATAIEITDRLRKYCNDDPVKYDWALSHMGIIRNNFADFTGTPRSSSVPLRQRGRLSELPELLRRYEEKER